MYTVVVSASLEFTLFEFNWPVATIISSIYVKSIQLSIWTSVNCCKELKVADFVMLMISAATEPSGNPSANPITIVRHPLPKDIRVEQPNFQATLSYGSAACEVFIDAGYKKELGKPLKVP